MSELELIYSAAQLDAISNSFTTPISSSFANTFVYEGPLEYSIDESNLSSPKIRAC